MRSALSSAAAMWFPSSNNVSVIYEWPTTIPAQPPQYSTISSPNHNKLRPTLLGHTYTRRPACRASVRVQCVCLLSACTCMIACRHRYVKQRLVHVPFGGGLTSVSPCWFELSDCPDCSERQKKREEKERDGKSGGQMSGHYPR